MPKIVQHTRMHIKLVKSEEGQWTVLINQFHGCNYARCYFCGKLNFLQLQANLQLSQNNFLKVNQLKRTAVNPTVTVPSIVLLVNKYRCYGFILSLPP